MALDVNWSEVHLPSFVAIGFTFSCVEGAVIYPLEVAKVNLQGEAGARTQSPWATLGGLYRAGGVGALYRGFWISHVGSVPSSVVYLSAYNLLKERGQAALFDPSAPGKTSQTQQHTSTVWARDVGVPLLSGLSADFLSLGVYTPIDVVTTHMQRARAAATHTGSAGDVVKSIWRADGWRGFYRGFLASALSYGPGSAIWWPTYEVAKILYTPALLSAEEANRLDGRRTEELFAFGGTNARASAVIFLSGSTAGVCAR